MTAQLANGTLAPTIFASSSAGFNGRMRWVQALTDPATQTLLLNGFAGIAFADVIPLFGASQVAIRIRYANVVGGLPINIGVAWLGDNWNTTPQSSFPETALFPTAPGGGGQIFNLNIAIFGPVATDNSRQVVLPACAHAIRVGMYSDGAPAVGTIVDVDLERLNNSSSPVQPT